MPWRWRTIKKTFDTYRTGAHCALHWHVHRMVVVHGNSVLIVNSACH